MASKFQRKPKVFIMGLSGFLGFHLARKLRENFTVVGCYFHNEVHLKDVHAYPVSLKNDTEMLERLVALQAPDFAISAVGISDIKQIHENAKVAENINIMLPLSFALMAIRNRAKHIFLNSADLFDGLTGNYHEDSKDFATMSGYGKMKATAEVYIRAQTMEGTTLRIGKVLGLGHPYRPSMIDDLKAKLQSEKIFYADENRTQSYLTVSSLAAAVEEVLLAPFPPNKQRVLHVGGPKATEMEMCQVLSIALGLNTKFLRPHPNHTKIDLSMQSKQMEENFKWRPETKEQLLVNFLNEMRPGLNNPRKELRVGKKEKQINKPGAKKPQKISRTP